MIAPMPPVPIEIKCAFILGIFMLGYFLGHRSSDNTWMSNADEPASEKIECRGKLFRVRHAR